MYKNVDGKLYRDTNVIKWGIGSGDVIVYYDESVVKSVTVNGDKCTAVIGLVTQKFDYSTAQLSPKQTNDVTWTFVKVNGKWVMPNILLS